MGCLWLTIVGGVLEGIGFGFIAWELARIQRQEFGAPQFVVRIKGWVRRLLRRPRVVELSAAMGGGVGSMRANLRVRQVPGETLEERVTALESNFEHLEGEFGERSRAFDQRFESVEQAQRDMRADLDQRRREQEEQRRESLRTSVTLQTWGTLLFVVGVVFNVLGSAISC